MRITIFATLIALISIVGETTSTCAAAPMDMGQFATHVELFTLSNGIRVVIYKRDQAPIFTGQVWVGVGGANEKRGNTGLAHFLEHMAFKGTEVVGTKDYQKEKPLLERLDALMKDPDKNNDEINSINAELSKLWIDNEFGALYKQRGGSGLNAGTSKDYTYYTVSLPQSEFEFWCWLESDRLLHPVFRQFYKEREVIKEERRMRYENDPGGQLYEGLLATAYQKHPYGLPLIGFPQDLQSVTPQQMKEFYYRYYRPDNIVISLAGAVDAAKSREILEKYFGRLPRLATSLPTVGDEEPQQTKERRISVRYQAQPQLIVAYHKPAYPNIDDFHFAVLHALLAEGRSSVFFRELVEKKKIFASIATTESPGEKYPSLFVVSGYPAAGVDDNRAVQEVQAILDKYQKKEFSAAELAAAKRRVQVSIISALEDNEGLAELLGKSVLFYGDWRRLLEFYETIEKTTAAEIQQLFKRYLNVANRTVAVLSDK